MIKSTVPVKLVGSRVAAVALLCLATPLASLASGCGNSDGTPSPAANAGTGAANAGASASNAGSGGSSAGASSAGANSGGANSGGANGGAIQGGQAGDREAQGGNSAEQGGDSGAGQAGAPESSLEQVIEHYRDWQSLSDQPVDISASIFGLCRLPTDAENAFITSAHNRYSLRDWVNPIASDALARNAHPVFPAGAAIVKEKFVRQASDGQLVLAALGVMLKREKDFDPAHADWQFGYWTEAKGLSSGGSEFDSCLQCHAKASTDYAYLDDSWRL